MARDKAKLIAIEQAVHAVLSPLGFKKQKSNWRRALREVLQQFSIVSDQLIASYQPMWGLNVIGFSEDPKPLPWRLHVQWSTAGMTKPRRRRMQVLYALDLETELCDEERARIITKMLTKDVLPCFEAFQTKEAVRRMARDWKYPLRAQMIFGLPDDWWPPN
jgi:hypothetical protein